MDISMSEKTQNEEVVGLDAKQVIFFPLTLDHAKPGCLQQARSDT